MRSVLVLLPVALALAACGGGEGDAAKKPRPPMLVGATKAAASDFAPRLTALGTVTPLQSVAVRPRVDGQITQILFKEGDNVRAGQPLFRLDDRAARADLAQARAGLSSARATAAQARADYQRAEQLVGKGFISKAVLDQRLALAEAAEAQIGSAQAAVASAETMLDYLTIRAPVSGRTGEIGFRLGANVRAGDAVPLVTVNQLSPIQVRFLVPPADIAAVRAAMAGPGITVTARPQATAADGTALPPLATGRLAFLDNNVDPGNGSVAAKAEFINVGDALWPGAIVMVELPLGASSPMIALPEAAVQTGRDAPFVWTIGADGKVAMRDVTVAGRADGKVYLASGVAPGEQIVTDALSKLKPGDKVRTRPGPGRPPSTATAPPSAISGG
jgi:multidrug efflux system membrane fusion protein